MDLDRISVKVMEGDSAAVERLVDEALSEGIGPDDLVSQYLRPAMQEVGRQFEAGELFIPEMMICAQAMGCALEVLKPHLTQMELPAAGVIVVGTVQGDLHDIGKSLVCMMMNAAGFEVHDLGVNVAPETFLHEVKRLRPHVVAMSALLTTTMPWMQRTIKALEEAGLRKEVLILVGGAPLTQEFADEIGADGYAADAAEGVRRAQELLDL